MAANRSSKPPTTVKLTDSDVTAIVHALGRFRAKDIAPDGTVREISALDQPALASLVARFELVFQSTLAELTREYIAARSHWNTCTGEITTEKATRYTTVAAVRVASYLGHHQPAMQGSIANGGLAFECRTCGATGRADLGLTGAIFSFKCGTVADLAAALKPEPVKLISIARIQRIACGEITAEQHKLCDLVLTGHRSTIPLPPDVAKRRQEAHQKLSELVAAGVITIE